MASKSPAFSTLETTATPTALVAIIKMRKKGRGNYTLLQSSVIHFFVMLFHFSLMYVQSTRTTTLHGLKPFIFSIFLSRSISPAVTDRVALAPFLSLFLLRPSLPRPPPFLPSYLPLALMNPQQGRQLLILALPLLILPHRLLPQLPHHQIQPHLVRQTQPLQSPVQLHTR